MVYQVREGRGRDPYRRRGSLAAKGCYVEVRPAVKKKQEVRSTFGVKVVETTGKQQNPAKKGKK